MMDLRLADRTAVVTGASRGIGLATVQALLAEGMRVVSGSRTVTEELIKTGALPVPVDLSTTEGATALIAQATTALGGIDVLVNNVGGGDADGLTLEGFLAVSDAEWENVFALNFFSAVRVTRAALPSLIQRRGVIINVSSIGARLQHTGPVAYTLAKTALNGLTTALAEEFGPQGVRIITVSPAPVHTAIWDDPDGFGGKMAHAAGLELDEFLDRLPDLVGSVTGRMIEPAEVAALITFLASPHAANITGADYLIDGGSVKGT
jgi:NAD(P)-dependent dehydrogenase (short-subunit alcohol dehydrogenase family)